MRIMTELSPTESDPSSEDVAEAVSALRSFVHAGYCAFPLKVRAKVPGHVGWRTRAYDRFDVAAWLRHGGNVGLRLRSTDLVIDDDPRNHRPGDDPLARLSAAVGVDLSAAPTVITGGGGRHHFWRMPADVQIVSRLPDYSGLDFKSVGGFVVAVGSLHPETGQAYRLDPDSPPIGAVAEAPGALIDLLRKPVHGQRREAAGVLTDEQLMLLLDALDPTAYGEGKYEAWIRLAAAAHDATGGAGLEAFTAWCTRDPAYVDAAETIERHWESFTAGKAGGVTYRTLFKAVSDAGRPDLVARLGEADEPIEHDVLVFELDEDNGDEAND